jgi:hypothetical protein
VPTAVHLAVEDEAVIVLIDDELLHVSHHGWDCQGREHRHEVVCRKNPGNSGTKTLCTNGASLAVPLVYRTCYTCCEVPATVTCQSELFCWNGSQHIADWNLGTCARTVQDVLDARELLKSLGLEDCKIIAKLDAKSSLVNFRGILNSADGIMLSRGNLGLDCLPEKIAVIQKNVTTSCNLVGKPCIVTRIVDTMVSAPRPTRAEATDVANAVLDGADSVMLGAETLRGMDPANAVRTVVACCHAAEAEFQHSSHFDYLMREAQKAESSGIAVPGGTDHEGGTPESSRHGSSSALLTMAAKAEMPLSQSHHDLTRSLRAMTRNARNESHTSSLSEPPPPPTSIAVAVSSWRGALLFCASGCACLHHGEATALLSLLVLSD